VKPLNRYAAFLLTLPLLAVSDPFIGTWRLDTYRSTFSSDSPQFLLGTIKIEPAGNGWKSTASGADGKGIASDFTFNCLLDGMPCKVTAATPMRSETSVDTMTLKRIDDHTVLATGSFQGRQVYSDRRMVSLDGKTLTVVRTGFTAEGKKYENTLVLARLR
jgi:hypothetical protein